MNQLYSPLTSPKSTDAEATSTFRISKLCAGYAKGMIRFWQISMMITLACIISGNLNSVVAQSNTCVPGQVENGNTDPWTEECYLNASCQEQGNPCQANDVALVGVFIADSMGNPISACNIGETQNVTLWGNFANGTGASRYAVRARTELFINGMLTQELLQCAFDTLPSGTDSFALLGTFSYTCGDQIQLVNTWVAWSTSAAQCTDPMAGGYSFDCGDYSPSKCSKNLGAITFLTPNFDYDCGVITATTTEVCFTDLSFGGIGGIVSWDWDFGDGGMSTLQNPCHTYNASSGTFTVTLTVTDSAGNVAGVFLDVDLDSLACCLLEVSCPPANGGVFGCLSQVPAADTNLVVVVDSCGPVTTTVQNTTTGTGCGTDTLFYTRLYIVTDGVLIDTCTQTFRVSDSAAPAITCPANVTVQCNTSTLPADTGGSATATDNCDATPTITFVDVTVAGACPQEFTITRTWTATDDCNNASTCNQVITVDDSAAPSITCPPNVTIECTASTDPASTGGSATATDNCDGSPTITFADVTVAGACPQEYTITRTWTATDDCNNAVTCNQIITVDDSVAPVIITCPADVTIECTASTLPADTGGPATATDNCDGTPVITFSDAAVAGACPEEYTITRTWIATDDCGNSATCVQLIVVDDSMAPSILCPASVTIACDASTLPASTGMAMGSDNCDPDPAITFSDATVAGACAQEYTINRTWIATDACGNSSTCLQAITLDDSMAPSITCPVDITIQCNTSTLPAATGMATATDNCDGMPTVIFTDATTAGACAQEYTITRTWTATDACNNSTQCVQLITVDDSMAPVLTCPPNTTVECNTSTAPDVTGMATATDNCDGTLTVTFTDVTVAGACPQEYTITRTWSATDDCNNTGTCIQIITVDDSIAPGITCPSDVTLECGSSTLPDPAAAPGIATATDNCDPLVIPTFSDVVTLGACPQELTITRTWTATDDCNNSTQCVQIIVVDDSMAPSILCPPDVTLECGSSTLPNPAAAPGVATATDDCDPLVIPTFSDVVTPGACPQEMTITRTWTATDDCNNSTQCVQIIVVDDSMAPIITCPLDVTLECGTSTAPNPAGPPGIATAIDNCDPDVVPTFTDVTVAGACPQEYTITRTWTATDDCNNSTQCVQIITIDDSMAPVVTCPPNTTVECNTSTAPDATGMATATDNCDATLTVTFTDVTVAGACPQEYTITRTWSATDDCNNTGTCIQLISVDDSIAPEITCPADAVVECMAGLPSNTGTATATDNCDPAPVVTFSDISTTGECAQAMTITRTWIATDACGNSATCVQTIAAGDNTPPEIMCPADTTIECDESSLPDNTGVATATDNCTAMPEIDFFDLAGPPPVAPDLRWVYLPPGAVNGDCVSNSDCSTGQLCFGLQYTPGVTGNLTSYTTGFFVGCVNGDNPITYNQSCVMEDNSDTLNVCGTLDMVFMNSSGNTGAFPVTQNVPVFIHQICIQLGPGESTLIDEDETTDLTTNVDLAAGGTTDESPAYTNFLAEYDLFCLDTCIYPQTIMRQWIATDECGNQSTCIQTIVIDDTTAPVLDCPVDVTVECNTDTSPATTGTADANDNCDMMPIITFADVTVAGACPQEFIVNRTWTAEDDCGNSSTCLQVITVDDSVAPAVTCPADVTVQCNTSTAPADLGMATATDDCDPVVTISSADVTIGGACPQEFTILRTWSATDDCNNTGTCLQIIVVDDSMAPVMTCAPNITIQCNTSTLPAATGMATATDNCDPEVIPTFVDITTAGACPQEFIITRVWTATDDCNNATNCTQVITVQDTIAPVITCPANVTVDCNTSTLPAATGMATASDNCDLVVIPTFADDTIGGACPQAYMITRTWTAADDCGNSSSCVQLIMVQDTTPPTFDPLCQIDFDFYTSLDAPCPADVTLSLAAGDTLGFGETWTIGGQIIPALDGCLFDNCTDPTDLIAVVDSIPSVINSCDATWTVYYTIYDACGNASADQFICIITFHDDVAPTLTCPVDITVDCGASTLPADTGMATATDDCQSPTAIIISSSDVIVPGTCPQEMTITRTWSATDGCGNTSTCNQVITVQDTIGPVFNTQCPMVFEFYTSQGAPCPADAVVSLFLNVALGIPLGESESWTVGDIVVPGADGCLSDNCSNPDSIVLFFTSFQTSGDDCDITHTITFQLIDQCGNFSDSVYTYTVIVHDDVAPVITCPVDLTIDCEDSTLPANTGSASATDDCQDPVMISSSDIVTPGSCPQEMTITRTWMADDGCENTSTCVQVITVQDTTPPTFDPLCQIDFDFYTSLDAPCPADVTLSLAAGDTLGFGETWTIGGQIIPALDGCLFDNCTDPADLIAVVDSIPSVINSCDATWTVYYTIYDACGNASAEQFICIISFHDDVAPTLTCPIDVTIECEASTLPANTGTATATDDCQSPTAIIISSSDVIAPGACPQELTITRTWTANDGCDNISTCVQVISVQDTTPPTFDPLCQVEFDFFTSNPDIDCPLDATISLVVGQIVGESEGWTVGGAVIPSLDGCLFDNCSPQDSLTARVESIVITGTSCDRTFTVSFTISDQCGNESVDLFVCVVNIHDDVAPVITCPVDVTVDCTASTSPDNTGTATATDDCQSPTAIILTSSDVVTPGACPQEMTITRTWSATDGCGNTSTCNQVIAVQDTVPPTFDPLCQVIFDFYTSEGAECPADVTISIEVGDTIGINDGWTLGGVTIPPMTGCLFDNCTPVDSLVSRVDSIVIGGNSCDASWTVYFTIIDQCGNESVDQFVCIINFHDDVAPIITCPADVTIDCTESTTTQGTGVATATDDCQSPTAIIITSSDVLVAGECIAEMTVLRTWSATDGCGNTSTCTQVIAVTDTVPPSWDPSCELVLNYFTSLPFVDCPLDATISLVVGQIVAENENWTVGGAVIPSLDGCLTDNCTPADSLVARVDSINISGTSCIRTFTVFFTIIDLCGNESVDQFVCVVNIIDNVPPTLICPENVTINCEDSTSPDSTGYASAIDDCQFDIVVIPTDSIVPGSCANEMNILRTWTVDDGCGNISSCVQLIAVQDITPPDFFRECQDTFDFFTSDPLVQCPLDVTLSIAVGDTLGESETWEITGQTIPSLDNCLFDNCTPADSLFAIVEAIVVTGNSCVRTWTVYLRIYDECGNASTALFIWEIMVHDDVAPVITCPVDVTVDCEDSTLPASTGIATATDDCQSPTAIIISSSDAFTPGECPQEMTIARTWTADDGCGNTSTCLQVITVQDTTPPTFDPLCQVVFDFYTSEGFVCPADVTLSIEVGDIIGINDGWLLGGQLIPPMTGCLFDNCTPVDSLVSRVDSIATSGTSCDSTWTIYFTIIDQCGNESAEQFICIINVHDDVAPVITCPADITIDCEASTSPDSTGVATATDDCQEVTITSVDVVTPGECPQEMTIMRTWTADDGCDNSSTCVQIITVQDTTPPTFDPLCQVIFDYYTSEGAVCPAEVTLSIEVGDIIGINDGWTIGGQSIPPMTDCLFDNCTPVDSLVSRVDSIATSGTSCDSTWTIYFTIIDQCGNESADQFICIINFHDDVAPVITCPADITIDCEASTSPDNTGLATATDDCQLDILITSSDVVTPGLCPQEMTITRTWTADDGCDNSSTCVQIITVQDTTPPTFDPLCQVIFDFYTSEGFVCPADVTLSIEVGDIIGINDGWFLGGQLIPPMTGCLFDNCTPLDSLVSRVDSIATGGTSCDSTWTIYFTIIDECGNESADQFICIINVHDDVAPVITCPADLTIDCEASTSPDSTGMATATDDCQEVTITAADVVTPGACPQEMTITRTWTADDGCDNSSTCVQIITVQDTTPPTFDPLCQVIFDFYTSEGFVCPTDVTLSITVGDIIGINDGWFLGGQLIPPMTGCLFDNCTPLDSLVSRVDSIATSGTSCDSTWTIYFTIIDQCGNESVDQFVCVINVHDDVAPVITCPADITIDCEVATTPDVTGMATATDDCQEVIITSSDVIVPGACPQEMTITRTWTADDGCDNSSTCVQVITVQDTTPPTFDPLCQVIFDFYTSEGSDCPFEIILSIEVGDTLGINDGWTLGNNTVPPMTGCLFDNCTPVDSLISRVDSIATSGNSCDSTWTVYFTIIDQCGNESVDQFICILNVHDDVAPVITCPVDITIECDESTLPDNTGSASATDDCQPVVAITSVDVIIPGACPQEMTIIRTWTADDGCDNSSTCVQTINVVDTTPPVLTCAANVTIQCDESTLPDSTGFSLATDNCDTAVLVVYTDLVIPSQLCLQEMLILRNWVATDDCGNIASCVQTITVIDTVAPVLTCAPNITIECDESTLPDSTGFTLATDNCDPEPIVEYTDVIIANETCPANYQIFRTWTATDACGNSASCLQTIVVDDTTPPVIVCPPDVTLACGDDTSPNNLPVEVTTYADEGEFLSAAGNLMLESFEGNTPENPLDVIPTANFTLTLSPSSFFNGVFNVGLTGAHATDGVNYVLTQNDSPSPLSTATFVFTMGINAFGMNITDWGDFGAGTLTFSNDAGDVYVVDVTPNPDGNDMFFGVINPGMEFTQVVFSHNITGESYGMDEIYFGMTAATGIATATDNCDPEPFLDYTDVVTPGNCPQEFVVERTWTATDDCLNSSTCVQIISVEDNIAPVFTVCPADVTIECDESTSPDSLGIATATDNCAELVTITSADVITPGECPQEMTIARTWTADDGCGNTSTCLQVITVQDTTPPTFNPGCQLVFDLFTSTPGVACPADATISLVVGQLVGESESWTVAGATIPSLNGCLFDNCSNPDSLVARVDSIVITGNTCDRTFTVYFTIIDQCGNESVDQFICVVNIHDDVAPVLTCPVDITIDCEAATSPDITGVATATDDCQFDIIITSSDVVVPGECPQEMTITRTWTADDGCDNSSTCVQIITVQDTTPPTFDPLCQVIFDYYTSEGAVCPADVTLSIAVGDTIGINDGWTIGGQQIPPMTDCLFDNCTPVDSLVSRVDSIATSGTSCDSTWTIYFTIIDQCGNESADQFICIINFHDDVAPVITCPADITIDCEASTSPDSTGLATATDDCQEVIITSSDVITPGECPQEMTITRTWTADDGCDNTSTCVQIITVQDTTPPTFDSLCQVIFDFYTSEGFVCPADVTLSIEVGDIIGINDGWFLGGQLIPPMTGCLFDNCTPVDSLVSRVDSIATSGTSCDSTWTIYFTIIDECGNESADQFVCVINVHDDVAPVLTCPADITIDCDASTSPDSTGVATATDDCQEVTITSVDVVTPGECPQEMTIMRTWTADDGCDNTSTCVQIITVQDTTPPTFDPLCQVIFDFYTSDEFVCPSDVTLSIEVGDIIGINDGWFFGGQQIPPMTDCLFDNCTPVDSLVSRVDSIATSGTSCDSTWTIYFTIIDQCGNESVDQFICVINVHDDVAPVITCPADLTIDCEASTSPDSTGVATATDDCQVVTITSADVVAPGECPQEMTITRTWTADDGCDNSSTCVQVITVQDTTPPTFDPLCQVIFDFYTSDTLIDCPADAIMSLEPGQILGESETWTVGGATIPGLDGCLFDNCSNPDSLVARVDSIVITGDNCIRTFTVYLTIIDQCSNESVDQFVCVVNIHDDVAPVITCPADLTIECDESTSPEVTGFATATDDCQPEISVSSMDVTVAGACPQEYTILRTWTADDGCANSSTCVQTIEVQDTTPPVITCPDSITVECAADVPVPNIDSVGATDNCGIPVVTHVGDVTVNQTCVNRFTLDRTYRATDECGNSSTCVQTITVFDDTPPMLTCPAAVTVQCASEVPPVNIGSVTSTDNCTGPAPVITHVSDVTVNQTCVNRFMLNRTYRATDDCGNSATCVQVITVFDNTPPMLTCPAPVTVECATDVPPVNIGGVTATDNCSGPAPVITHVSDVTVNQTCINRFMLNRTYRATDACGNSATCVQVITVFDDTPPMLTCPAAITVQCAVDVPVPNPGSVTATDNCSGPPPVITHVSDVTVNQTCINRYTLNRTYRATDACGNSATCVQVITVFDNTPPVIEFVHPLLEGVPNGGTIEVQCYGQDPNWELPVFDESSVEATDNCTGPVTVVYTEMLIDEGDCDVDGYINRYRMRWTATDACGNSSSATVFLNLVDTIPPVIIGVPEDITVNCDEIPEQPMLMATDECLCACITELDQIGPAPGCQNGQVIIRTWMAIDDCGNVTIDTQLITLIDEEGPVLEIVHPEIAGLPDGTILEYTCNEGGIPEFFDDLSAEDVFSPAVCDGFPNISLDVESHENHRNCKFFGHIEQRIYTWTGVDDCGNQTTLTLIVRLVDNEPPVIVGAPAIACIGDPALEEVQAIDNCGDIGLTYWDVPIESPCGDGPAFRRTWEAIDPCGNYERDTTILIQDETPPVIHFINPDLLGLGQGEFITTQCDDSEGYYTNWGLNDVEAMDACGDVALEFEQVIMQDYDCEDNTVVWLNLIWTATDMCGNSSSLYLYVYVEDNEAPSLVDFDSEITIGCNDTLPAILVNDNCSAVTVTTVDSIIGGDCEFEYDIIRTITAVDACGNVTNATQVVHVGDGSGPDIEGVVEEVCDDLSIPDVTGYDPCTDQEVPVTMTEEIIDSECQDGYVVQRTWTATDACGNVASIIQTIYVDDHTPPVIQVPTWSIINFYLDQEPNLVNLSEESIILRLNALNESSVYVVDDCDELIIPVFTVDVSYAADCEAEGYYERRVYTWVATDPCGNSAVLKFTIDIMDDIPPVLHNTPDDITVICDQLPPAAPVHATDYGSPVTIEYVQVIGPDNGEGEFTVKRTWTATDPCGNQTSYTQTILWIPDTFIDCDIILPGLVDCNSHGVTIGSDVAGGIGPFIYEWEIEGEKCFIQSGQGTAEIDIYIGFGDVDIFLTVTDAYGCTGVCNATLSCLDPFDDALTVYPIEINPVNGSDGQTAADPGIDYLRDLSFWPNPTATSVNVRFESLAEHEVEISFTNFLGQIVKTEKVNAFKGINTRKIDVSLIPDGTYLMQVKTEKEIHTNTVVVMRR